MTLTTLIPLWLAPVLQLVLVLVMWRRRRFFLPRFLAFFRYTSFAVLAGFSILTVVRSSFWYFWTYWVTNLIYGILALLVMREVFQTIWDMKRGLRRFAVWALLLMLGAAATVWGLSHPDGPGRFGRMTAVFDAFGAGVNAVEITLCCFALLVIKRFNQYQIGIMLGFAVYAFVALLAYVAYHLNLKLPFLEFVVYTPTSAYIASIGAWLLIFLSRPRFVGKLDPQKAIELMRRQEEMAQDMVEKLGVKRPRDDGQEDKRSAPKGTMP